MPFKGKWQLHCFPNHQFYTENILLLHLMQQWQLIEGWNTFKDRNQDTNSMRHDSSSRPHTVESHWLLTFHTANTTTCWLRLIVAAVAEELFWVQTEIQVSLTGMWYCPRVRRKRKCAIRLFCTRQNLVVRVTGWFQLSRKWKRLTETIQGICYYQLPKSTHFQNVIVSAAVTSHLYQIKRNWLPKLERH